MQGRNAGSGRVNSDMRARGAQPRQKRPGPPPRLTGVGLQASNLSPENTSAKKAQQLRNQLANSYAHLAPSTIHVSLSVCLSVLPNKLSSLLSHQFTVILLFLLLSPSQADPRRDPRLLRQDFISPHNFQLPQVGR
jgi:hypothetical protein